MPVHSLSASSSSRFCGEVDARRVVVGEPVPSRRDFHGADMCRITPWVEMLEEWKESGPCTHGSGEMYVRKHWYRIRTSGGDEMKIYFERKARSAREVKKRWWLYTLTPRGSRVAVLAVATVKSPVVIAHAEVTGIRLNSWP